MFWPYFQFGCSCYCTNFLEINSQRTSAYVLNRSQVCGSGEFSGALTSTCDCPPLYWEFPEIEGDPIEAASYVNPIVDEAPWYDADIPESGQFLGYWIKNVEQGSMVQRSITSRATVTGGGAFGPNRLKERRLDFEVLLFACNELAMEYGFRFLSDVLSGRGCEGGSCALCEAEFRDSCPAITGTPTEADLNKGRWLLKDVGVLEGPKWDKPPVEGFACNVRTVRFSLVSESAWRFKPPVTECADLALADTDFDGGCGNLEDVLCGAVYTYCAVEEPLLVGETAFIISIFAGDSDLQHTKIELVADPFGYVADPGSAPVGWEPDDPLDTILIPWLPANSYLVYDTASESVAVELPGGIVRDGSPFIGAAAGAAPTYPSIRCGSFALRVSANGCSVDGATMTVQSVHREL